MSQAIGSLRGSYGGDRGDPGFFIRPITASTVSTAALLPDGPCRAIQLMTTALISFMDPAGSTVDNFPVHAFDNPIGVKALYSITGASTLIWAIY